MSRHHADIISSSKITYEFTYISKHQWIIQINRYGTEHLLYFLSCNSKLLIVRYNLCFSCDFIFFIFFNLLYICHYFFKYIHVYYVYIFAIIMSYIYTYFNKLYYILNLIISFLQNPAVGNCLMYSK